MAKLVTSFARRHPIGDAFGHALSTRPNTMGHVGWTRLTGRWLALFVLLAVTCVRAPEAYTFSDGDRNAAHGIMKQLSIDPYTHHKLPVLKMLKRQIKNFRTGRKASLTLVFTSNEPVDTNWFEIKTINSQEVMFPILQGHPHYELSMLHSGDVTATSLSIPLRQHGDDHVFETILTNENGTMQYQLKTVLDSKVVYRLENIDSPEWLVVPPHVTHLSQRQTFQRHCRSFARLEHGGNALFLMYAQPVLTRPADRSGPEFRKMVQTHDFGQENHAEELGTMILEGRMHRVGYRTSRAAAVFDVRAKQPNADRTRQGIYMCTMERLAAGESHLDKFHILSYVTVGRHQSLAGLLPPKPRVEVVSCATSDFRLPNNALVLIRDEAGCVRCRGYGHPTPDVEIRRKYGDGAETELTLTSSSIAATRYTNVAEAGIVEAIYVFDRPDHGMTGPHLCVATNANGALSIFFDIKLRSKRS